MMRADFTITVRDTDAGCWITMRGNRTGTTVQRCVATNSVLMVVFAIARMWIQSAAKMHPERALAISVDRSRSYPRTASALAVLTAPPAERERAE